MRVLWTAVFLVAMSQAYAWSPARRLRPPPRISCDPVKCEDGCFEMMAPNGCPTCVCTPPCSPPKCPPGCKVEVDFKGPCPGCDCGQVKEETGKLETDLTKALCDPVKCEGNCREALGPNGCPTCLCDPLCSPPKCGPGCEIETEFEGPCPGCKCAVGKGGFLRPDLTKAGCDPVKCEKGCREVVAPNGCPKCECDPLCSPPKCPPGCQIEMVFEGPCPGCKCDDEKKEFLRPDLTKPHCDPVKCEGNCREVQAPNGCPTCFCDPVLCSPPKCPPGCEIETVFQGPCPGCKCEEDIRDKCPPVEECSKPGCKQTLPNILGCVSCVCNEIICDPPKCGFGCRLQPPKSEGLCPTCVCVKPWSRGRRH